MTTYTLTKFSSPAGYVDNPIGVIFMAMLLILLSSVEPAEAADIGACQRQGDLCISGIIDNGDASRFAAVAKHYPPGTVVWLDGPGGRIFEALDIGDTIHRRGFSTAVSIRTGLCGSACALLFLSGYHAIIERNSTIVFHQGFYADTGEPISSEDVSEIAKRMVRWGGVTKWQALALLYPAPPGLARSGTEAWARQLGFSFVYVPSLFGMWRSCAAKFCVALNLV
jgi:hypothetical protein